MHTADSRSLATRQVIASRVTLLSRRMTTARYCLTALFVAAIFAGPARAQQPVTFQRQRYRIEVRIAGQPFTTYYFDPAVAKPYLMPLRSARGTVVTRQFPIGNTVPPDHEHDPNLEPHQRPLYFAHGNIDGVDFWGEDAFNRYYPGGERYKHGRTVFRRIITVRAGSDHGTIAAEFELVGPDGRHLATELQSYTFRADDKQRIIDCHFVIRADKGPVKMGDTKEGTFAIRVAKELQSPPGTMVSSTGGKGEKEIWGKQADWVDYFGTINGEQLGIAIFDSPKSFHHPTYWHARAYGLFAANPFGLSFFQPGEHANGTYDIPAGSSIDFYYRVVIHPGDYQQAKIAEQYQRYASAASAPSR